MRSGIEELVLIWVALVHRGGVQQYGNMQQAVQAHTLRKPAVWSLRTNLSCIWLAGWSSLRRAHSSNSTTTCSRSPGGSVWSLTEGLNLHPHPLLSITVLS